MAFTPYWNGTNWVYNGTSGSDYGTGTSEADIFMGNEGPDTMYGGAGNDTFYCRVDGNYIDGGADRDMVHYQGAQVDSQGRGLYVDLSQNAAYSYGSGKTDTLVNIEDIFGSTGNDTIVGSSAANVLSGYDGNDVIAGMGGNDTIYGGYGNDTLDGGSGADYLYGGVGNDVLFGGSETDYLYGEEGNDILDGGSGTNYLRGGKGNDQYEFYNSGGKDFVYENKAEGADVVCIYDFNSVSFGRNSNNLQMSAVNSVGQQTIMEFVNWFVDFGVEYFAFAGTNSVYTAQDVASLFGVTAITQPA